MTAQAAKPQDAPRVYFVSPKDGAKVAKTLKVKFGVRGMALKPAGESMDDKTKGHHHLIVDGTFVAKDQVVPTDEKHIHFGKAQTETEITLAPGTHTLTLQFADGAHRSYGEALSATIKVLVE